MRIISFSKMWAKLSQSEFTTFRFPRKDAYRGREWHEGEEVQVYFKSRSPTRQKLGDALIVRVEKRLIGDCDSDVTEAEAIADGFDSIQDMENWMIKTHGAERVLSESMNKITLRYI